MRRVGKRAPVSADYFTHGGSALVIDRCRRKMQFLALAIEANWTGADRMSHGSNTVQRARTVVTSSTPRTHQLRARPIDPALARVDLDWPFHFALCSDVDSFVAFLPVNGAALAELVLEDQSIQNALSFVHRASDIRVVDRHGADLALGIDYEQRPLSNALIFDQHAVVAAELVVTVADQGNVHASQTALHLGRGVPCPQSVLAVRASKSDGTGPAVEEFLQPGGEGYDFCRADEGPGFGEENQDQPVLGLGVGG